MIVIHFTKLLGLPTLRLLRFVEVSAHNAVVQRFGGSHASASPSSIVRTLTGAASASFRPEFVKTCLKIVAMRTAAEVISLS
jgi:hypothetical protein